MDIEKIKSEWIDGNYSSYFLCAFAEDDEAEEEPPANTMEELLFRELAVLKLGLNR